MIKIIDFYADWCNPCKTMLPIFDSLKETFNNIEFEKVNIESNEDSQKYGISSVPTFLILKNGIEMSRKTGVINKSDFIDWIRSYDKQDKKIN